MQVAVNILFKTENKISVIGKQLKILEIDSHINSFVINQNFGNTIYEIIDVCDISFPTMHLIHLPNNKVVVKFKTPFS